MQGENPTAGDGGASITERLESFLAAEESPAPEPKAQPAELQADEPDTVEEPQIEPESGEPESDEGPQLSTADLAKFLGIDESMLDLDEDGTVQLKTKIDGKEGAAKLNDVLKSYQLQGHIDNKARAVAEQEKAIQARMQQVEQAAQQRLQQLEAMANVANQELMREFQSIDWNNLRASDPGEYSAKLADFQLRQGQLQQMFAAVNESRAQQAQTAQAQMQAFMAEQAQKLPELIPEWKDEATAKKESAEIKEWGVKQGLDPQELASVNKAAYVSVLRKAMLYDQLQQSKASVENKVRTAPKLVKAGQAQPVNRQQQNVKDLRQQVRKSGGNTDAVAAFLLATGKA